MVQKGNGSFERSLKPNTEFAFLTYLKTKIPNIWISKVLQLKIFRDGITGLQLNSLEVWHDTVCKADVDLLQCINLWKYGLSAFQ